VRTDATDSHKHLYANSQASSRREKARRPWRRGFAPRPGEDGVRITVRSVDGIPFTVWGGDDPGHPIQNGANNQVRNRWAERRPNYLSPLVTQAVREDERPAAARRRRLATTERKGCPRARPLGEVFFSAPGGCARVLRLHRSTDCCTYMTLAEQLQSFLPPGDTRGRASVAWHLREHVSVRLEHV